MEPRRRGLGERLYAFAYRYLTALVKSAQLVFLSLRFWSIPFWLKFWTWRGAEIQAAVGGLTFWVRSRRLHVKLTDLYMITSCVIFEQYNGRPGFELGPEDTIVDVGGHIGSFSVYAGSRARRGRVFTFEPNASSYTQLVKNLQANGLGHVVAAHQAVGRASETRTLYSAKLNSAENNFYRGGTNSEEVACTTLEEIFRKHKIERCDFLKVDCEGAEYEIFTSTPQDVLAKVRRIGIEAHVGRYFGIDDPAAVPRTLIDFLRKSGFELEVWTENALHTFIWARRR